MDNAPADIEKIKSQVGSRLVDGGYVDNTAVTSALYSIQHSNSSKNNDQDRKRFFDHNSFECNRWFEQRKDRKR